MSLSDDLKKMGDLYCENLGLGPQASPSLNPAVEMPAVVRQDPKETLNQFKEYFRGIQCPKMRKQIALEILQELIP